MPDNNSPSTVHTTDAALQKDLVSQLHEAIRLDNLDAAKLILTQSCDFDIFNAQGKNGDTALHVIIRSMNRAYNAEKLAFFVLLLEGGANIYAKNNTDYAIETLGDVSDKGSALIFIRHSDQISKDAAFAAGFDALYRLGIFIPPIEDIFPEFSKQAKARIEHIEKESQTDPSRMPSLVSQLLESNAPRPRIWRHDVLHKLTQDKAKKSVVMPETLEYKALNKKPKVKILPQNDSTFSSLVSIDGRPADVDTLKTQTFVYDATISPLIDIYRSAVVNGDQKSIHALANLPEPQRTRCQESLKQFSAVEGLNDAMIRKLKTLSTVFDSPSVGTSPVTHYGTSSQVTPSTSYGSDSSSQAASSSTSFEDDIVQFGSNKL